MKKFTRILTAVLALIMLGTSVPMVQAATPDAVTQPQVAQRLDLLLSQLNGKYFTVTQQPSTSSGDSDQCGMVKVLATDWLKNATNGMIPKSLYTADTFTHYFNGGTWVRGSSCCGFANYAQWYVFAQDSADIVKTKEVAFVSFNKANMLKYAQPGDVIRLGETTKSSESTHSAVIYSIGENGVTVVDCNSASPTCNISKYTISYTSSYTTKHYKYVGITRATNYEYPTGWYTVDISDTSEGLVHRSGPGTNYTQLQRVPKNTKIKIIDSAGKWGKYEYNGVTGWSNMDYMAFTGTYVDTVIFDPGGGSGTMDPIYFDVGTGFRAPECGFDNPGYRFVGWTLANTDIGKWRCVSADGSTIEWMTEAQAASKNYTKYLYAENQLYNRIARTDQAATYRMVAQWERSTCETPVVTATSNAVSGKPKLTWNAIDGAAKYAVYRSTSQTGTYTSVGSTISTTFEDTSAPVGGRYYYRVKAIGGSGTENSRYSSTRSAISRLARPAVTIKADTASGKPVLSWDAQECASKYVIYRADSSDGTYTALPTTTKTTYTDTTAEVGAKYYYRVKAVHATSTYNSAQSPGKSCMTKCAQPAATVSANAASGKPVLKWNAVEGVYKYVIYRSTTKSSGYVNYATTTSTTFTDTGAEAGVRYYYKVKAANRNSSANSALSAIINRTCDLIRPTATVSLNSSGKPVVKWAAVEGASKYGVYIYDASGNEIKSYTTTNLSLTYKAAVAGTTYKFRVAALHEVADANSARSTFVSITSR